jgi:hypothetical protein
MAPGEEPPAHLESRERLRGGIGRLSVGEFFALVNWGNDPVVRAVVRQTLAINPNVPDPEVGSVGTVMAGFGWDDE